MNFKVKRTIVCLLLICCFTLSACGVVTPPSDLDDFLAEKVPQTALPTVAPTAQPTQKPIEENDGFGKVDLSETEDILRSYYGITFADSKSFQANFEYSKGGYVFSPITFGVTASENLICDDKITIIATVSAFDHFGNSLTNGIVSNMSKESRASEFGDSYIHGLSVSFPGTYYVTYNVTVKTAEESKGSETLKSEEKTYTISRKYEVEKVDAYIESVSDFYFVKVGGASEKGSADIKITTVSGWDITAVATEDLYKTTKIQLYVPILTVETDKAGSYPLDITASLFGEDVGVSEATSKYFNFIIQNGKRYIIPAQDEVAVKLLYDQIASVGIDRDNQSYDYSKWADYCEIAKAYCELSETQEVLFGLYSAYLLKYDKNFLYNQYYDMNARHNFMLCLEKDYARAKMGEELALLVEKHKSSGSAEDLAEIANFLFSLSNESVEIQGLIDSSLQYFDSDLSFAVKFAFEGEFEKGENGYVDILENGGVWHFANSNMPVNLLISAGQTQFEMFSLATKTLEAIANGESETALEIGLEYYRKYVAFCNVLGRNESADKVLEIVREHINFEFDTDKKLYVATASETLEKGEMDISSLKFAFSYVRECLYFSFEDLSDDYKTNANYGDYATAVSTCENFLLKLIGMEETTKE